MKILLAFTVLAAAVAAQPYSYRLTDLGVLPGRTGGIARGISPDGTKIVGSFTDRAFLWEEGRGMRELPTLPGYSWAYANDVNDAALVCGQAGLEVTGPQPARAVLWDPSGVALNLGTMSGGRFSMAYAINRAGAVVGTTEVFPSQSFMLWHAFLRDPLGGMLDLTPGTETRYGRGLNDFGQVTGWSGSGNPWRHDPSRGIAFLGQPQGFAFTAAYAINDAGQVCGSTTSASGNTERIVRYTDGVGWEILGGVGEHNIGFGINDLGQVVGASRNAPRAFLYSDGLGLQDLNSIVDLAGRWFILEAYDVNDRGQISAHAIDNNLGETHPIRLDPLHTTVRGSGCAGGSGHVPKLAVAGLPAGGRRISILMAEGKSNGQALLAIARTTNSVSLPGGCTLLVGWDAVAIPIALDQIGRSVLPIDIPAGVMAATLHAQYVSLDISAPNGWFALSNAVQLQIL